MTDATRGSKDGSSVRRASEISDSTARLTWSVPPEVASYAAPNASAIRRSGACVCA